MSTKSKAKRILAARGVTVDMASSLGSGGQGTVYRAIQVSDGLPVAVKLLTNSKRIGRFAREIATMERLTSAGVTCVPAVRGKVVDIDAGVAAYWMPVYEGGSLQVRLDNGGLGDPLVVVEELVRAVLQLRHHGVSHRDIKPTNILFGGDGMILADFGLCRDVASDEGDRLTASEEQIGSRRYMAPELADGRTDSEDNLPADLYSMSKVIWCVLRQRPQPFDREDRHWDPQELPSTVMRWPELRHLETRLRNWMAARPEDRSMAVEGALDDVARIRRPVATLPAAAGEADPGLLRKLDIMNSEQAANDHQIRVAKEASPEVVFQNRTEEVTRWFRMQVETTIGPAITTSPAFDALNRYAERDLVITVERHPPQLDTISWDTDSPARPPRSMVDPTNESEPDCRTPWRYTKLVFPIIAACQRAGEDSRRLFALVADVGTHEVRLTVTRYRLVADVWNRERRPDDIVEYCEAMAPSTVERCCELAIVTLEGCVRYIEDLVRSI